MSALLFLQDKREKRQLHAALYTQALAATKNTDAIMKQLEKWEREL